MIFHRKDDIIADTTYKGFRVMKERVKRIPKHKEFLRQVFRRVK